MLSSTAFVLWLLTTVVECAAQLSFKAAASAPIQGEGLNRWKQMARRPWIWLGVLGYAACFMLWTAFVSLVPLSVGVLLISFNIVVLMLAGRWLFDESLLPLRVTGIALITLGVIAVGWP
jgi:multidrug transporter EmrE-like cation transporter